MLRTARLRPLLAGLVLLPLLCAWQRPASALVLLQDVSPKRAAELGITVHALPRPSEGDVRVQVDFRTTGALKGFSWADLVVMRDGKRLLMVMLDARKQRIDSTPEEKRVEFYIDPAALPDATVTVVSYSEPRTGIGYRLQMKDFLPQRAAR